MVQVELPSPPQPNPHLTVSHLCKDDVGELRFSTYKHSLWSLQEGQGNFFFQSVGHDHVARESEVDQGRSAAAVPELRNQ